MTALRDDYLELRPYECWPWLGRLDSDGYGMFGRNEKAHRAAYEDQVGPIPPGLSVLHHCDFRPCCNGRHLFAGTQQDNLADMRAKGRQAIWADQPRAKLSVEQVLAIRADPRPSRELAQEYGMDRRNISRVKARVTYRSVA
jgi:hypothetical protein